jgi:hypothetical protein
MKISLSIIVLSCVTVCSAQAAKLYTEDFESYKTDATLHGQGNWNAGTNPKVIQGVGFNTTKVVSNGDIDGVAMKAITLSWGTKSKGSFSFDTYFGGINPGNLGYAGIGASYDKSLGFTVVGTSINYRQNPVAGPSILLTDIAGVNRSLTAGKWYNITANFTLADNTITDVWLTNLTDGGPAVQLYFGAATATHVYTTEAGDESTWDTVTLRLPPSTGSVRMIDNIELSGNDYMMVGGVSIDRDILLAYSSSPQGADRN